ncbi:MAG: hypothetical protein LAP38_27600 [Acidobacteriia bacterium]|nr:hypothetical protein [Terriglobia bacterium]
MFISLAGVAVVTFLGVQVFPVNATTVAFAYLLLPQFLHRTRKAAYWIAPSLLTVVLYWPGLMAWFQKDDFVWLKLLDIARKSQGFRWALFTPLAQGTIRTLSERVFFMSFSALFGVNALPYRCWALLTFAASLVVVSSLCARLTGSRAAGFWAAILWTVNSSMGVALSWTAIYYEILCSLFLLGGIWLLVRYAESGQRRFYLAQWITFVIGFGVLELNVVYPALAAAYALCCNRRLLAKIWPMFLVSAAYTLIHTVAAPLPAGGPYKLHWDTSVLSTLWTYWKWALGPNRLIYLRIYPSPYRSLLTILLMSGLLGFLLCKMLRREWVTAFFAAWFVIVLAPLLPLRDHIDPSYLTIPLAGFAMWGGWAVVSGWNAGRLGRIAAVFLLGIYLAVSIPIARVTTLSFYDGSQAVRSFVLGIVARTRGQESKLVLLRNVDSEMFWSAVYDRPFPLFGINEVYLLPDDQQKIVPEVPASIRSQFFADSGMLRAAFEQQRAIVLDTAGGHVRDVTASYVRSH